MLPPNVSAHQRREGRESGPTQRLMQRGRALDGRSELVLEDAKAIFDFMRPENP